MPVYKVKDSLIHEGIARSVGDNVEMKKTAAKPLLEAGVLSGPVPEEKDKSKTQGSGAAANGEQ